MKQKFRAVIPESNAVIIFTLKDLIENKFSNREILWKWINKGNEPDRFIGISDKNGKDVYERDILYFKRLDCNIVIQWSNVGYRWTYSAIGKENNYYVNRSIDEDIAEYIEVIGRKTK